ncbi:MAG: diguanylate cyclase [Desulforhopalus sp.]
MSKLYKDEKIILAEVDELRRQVNNLKEFEQRCRRAEAALKENEERNQILGDSTPLGIFTVDLQGNITGINRKMRELFSLTTEPQPTTLDPLVSQAIAVSGISNDIQRCIDRNNPVIVEHPYKIDHADTIHLRYNLSPVATGDGAISGVMAIVEDYTDLKRAEEAIRESERRYRQLFQSAPIAMIEWDVSRLKSYLDQLRKSGVADFRTYFEEHPEEVHHCWELIQTADFNDAFLDLMGIPKATIPNGAFLPTDAKEFFEMAREVILVTADGHTAVEREETIVTTSGETKIVLGKSLVVSGHEDTLERVAIGMVDISQRKKAEKALRESECRFREQAFRDGLTGLYNQRYLYQSLKNLIDCTEATNSPISLLFMDMDHFKKVVDTYGHLNGSRAILEVARTIDSCLIEPAYAVAYAGDEFVVVLPGMDQDQAFQKASEIHCKVRDTTYQLAQDIEVRLTASIGIATFPQHATDLHGLIAAADHALFAIKAIGKDAIGQFQPS